MSDVIFKGLSTSGGLFSTFTYYDIELIKKDLYNHFMTRVGERVMRPTYGCKIWDYLMEQNTTDMRDMIYSEALRIFQSDARVVVNNIQIFWVDDGVKIDAILNYLPFDTASNFIVEFNNRQS